MELYITEISKYVIALLMALYAYESFAVFRFQEEERRGGIYTVCHCGIVSYDISKGKPAGHQQYVYAFEHRICDIDKTFL